MRKKLLHIAFLTFTLIFLSSAGAQSVPAAAEGRLPPGCLGAGMIDNARALFSGAAALQKVIDGQEHDLLKEFGGKLGNPEWAGVDVAQPIHFFWMDPKRFARPWAYQFAVADAAKLRAAYADNAEVGFRINAQCTVATVGDPEAVQTLAEWREPVSTPLPAPQVRFLLDVQGVLRVFGPEFEQQVAAMKDRMREALERDRKRPDLAGEIAATQADLEKIITALQQVKEIEAALCLEPGNILSKVSVRPLPGSLLEKMVAGHPRGRMELLKRCPKDATLVVLSNLSVSQTAKRMAMQFLGLPGMDAAPAAISGERLLALFVPPGGPPVEILDLRSGEETRALLTQWAQWSNPPEGTKPPFRLGAGEGTNTTTLAQVLFNEEVLGPRGMKLAQYLLGPSPRAMLSFSGALVVGADPAWRMAQVEKLAEKDALPVPTAAYNLFLHVSADGVRRWLGLSGLPLAPPDAREKGLSAGLALNEDGTVRAMLLLPTTPLVPIAPPDGN